LIKDDTIMNLTLQQIRETALSILKKTAINRSKTPITNFAQKGALKAINTLIGQAIPFASRNRFSVTQLGNGSVTANIPLKGNKNHIGTMYAGALFTVAELPGGILSIFNFSAEYYPILKELKMTYLKVAKTDVIVEFSLSSEEIKRIEQEASQKGKSDFTLHGELKDTQGNIVAKSEAHYQVRKQVAVN